MASLSKIFISLAVFSSSLILSGCSNLVPGQHKEYLGSDAATLVIQQEEVAGVVLILYYENKGECFNRSQSYAANPDMFDWSKKVLTFKIPPGKFLAIEQTYKIKKQVYPYGPYGDYLLIKKLPFISQPGKRYYFAVDRGVHEIPNDYLITSNTDPVRVIREFPQLAQPSWDASRLCKHMILND